MTERTSTTNPRIRIPDLSREIIPVADILAPDILRRIRDIQTAMQKIWIFFPRQSCVEAGIALEYIVGFPMMVGLFTPAGTRDPKIIYAYTERKERTPGHFLDHHVWNYSPSEHWIDTTLHQYNARGACVPPVSALPLNTHIYRPYPHMRDQIFEKDKQWEKKLDAIKTELRKMENE